MEVGAVKQAFNNEVILLKKKLNQAKIQIIHKLTRKAKTLAEKKAPEHLKEKNRRKAESAVQEVLIIKKIKARDLAKFIITHTGELNALLNKPKVDHDKGCTRLLLHKALQDKYQFIRNRFRDVPIKDLFMSRQERLKLKKEAKEKQKNKKKKRSSSETEWKVENVDMVEDVAKKINDDDDLSNDNQGSDREQSSDNGPESDDNADDESHTNDSNDTENDNDSTHEQIQGHLDSDSEESDGETHEKIVKLVAKTKPILESSTSKTDSLLVPEIKFKNVTKSKAANKKPEKKLKENKNKNINEKILKRKFKKEIEDVPVLETKIVDPFFITESGENYMSVAEPRPPDEVKEVHKEGNRKLRRAVMFGHVPKPKPRQNYGNDNKIKQERYGKQNDYEKNNFNDKPFNKRGNYNDRNKSNERVNFSDRHIKSDNNDGKPEKLHPSWEAKKKQSGILPFQGKKIVFH